MNQQNIEQSLRFLYCRMAEEIQVPNTVWEEIRKRSDNAPRTMKLRKRTTLILVAVLVLMLGGITCYATIRKAEVKGYGTTESFSVKFEEFEGIAENSGYPGVKAVESTSDGYKYLGVWRSFNQSYDGDGEKIGSTYTTLSLRYRGDGKVATVGIYPADEYKVNPNQIVEVLDWDGITVYQTLYVHFSMPTDWEDKITEEQQHLLDIGVAGGGVSGEQTEITRYDITGYTWKQGDYCFYVSHEYFFRNMTAEDLEVLAREMVEVNRRLGEK